MKLEEVIERLKDDVKYADLRDTVDDDCTICFIEDVETVLQELEHLQKENLKLTNARNWYFEHTVNQIATPEMLGKILEDKYISKNKIRELLEDYKKGVDCTYCNNTCSRYILCTNLLKEEWAIDGRRNNSWNK